MSEEQKLLSDVKYKQFVAAIDKSLKNFEYSSEWADLISCLGRLNKVIQTYSRYSAVPRKLLIGKRLAQCLHPALPSGVHLKVLESYDLIFTQIGANRLAQDLFIYTSGLFPLLSQASMSVKPVLLDLYETHLLPLRKKLYPGLSGFLLALLPGIEEVSEYTERTIDILMKLCNNIDDLIFFACLWDCILHSSQNRLPAMTFILSYMTKRRGCFTDEIVGSDVNLMVNAICASLDDANVLVQRITLDFVISFISFHTTSLEKKHLVKLLTYALGVFLRRDMSLNRRIFQWLLNINGEGQSLVVNGNASQDDRTDDEIIEEESYFESHSKELLIAAIVILFQDVVKNYEEYVDNKLERTSKAKSPHLKSFRVLITLLDRPEIGSAILENVLLEVIRMLYQYHIIKKKYQTSLPKQIEAVRSINDELIKNGNLLFNSFEPFYLWDYIGRLVKGCSHEIDEEQKSSEMKEIVTIERASFSEIFVITSYLLDVVALEASTETQVEHWPNLLKLIIEEMIAYIAIMGIQTVSNGIILISKLLSRVSPNIQAMTVETKNDQGNSILSQKSPPMSPLHQDLEFFSQEGSIDKVKESEVIMECVNLSKKLFRKFINSHVLTQCHKTVLILKNFERNSEPLSSEMDSVTEKCNYGKDDEQKKSEAFAQICRYIVQLSCFPVAMTTSVVASSPDFSKGCENVEEWLQTLICCCFESSFDVKAVSISCFLDLVNVVITVEQNSQSSTSSIACIVPLITKESLRWIENSNVYERLAERLWESITPTSGQHHQVAVDLFLRLHNIAPSGSTCENVISSALVQQNLGAQELAHWRFSVLWHLSREFYRDDNNKANKGVRTIDKCLLLMLDNLHSDHTTIKECAHKWLKHCMHFGDIGRILEPLLLVLLNPASARVAIHYSWRYSNGANFRSMIATDNKKFDISIKQNEMLENKVVNEKLTDTESANSEAAKEVCEDGDDEEDEEDLPVAERTDKSRGNIALTNGKLPTHPLLIHKLLYTGHYDTHQMLYALKRLLLVLNSEGHAFILSAATTSMSVCSTPHQSLLRELLIRHRRVLSGKQFFGSLADAHQLLIRASTAKYLEVLLSVCLYFIRSEYLDGLDVSEADLHLNFSVQTASAEVLTRVVYILLEISNESGKGFASYINDLASRSKIQRIALHCLLSTVYSVTNDFKEITETGYYAMVDNANLTESKSKEKLRKYHLNLRKSILKLIESLIHLEHCIGTENVANKHMDNKNKDKHKNDVSVNKVPSFEYVPYIPILSQPMFISATLTVLREKKWTHLHNDWIKVVISCLSKFTVEMQKLIVPLVEQLCENCRTITTLYQNSYDMSSEVSDIELPPDYALVLIRNITSICHYCLINTSTATVVNMSPTTRSKNRSLQEETNVSMFSNLINVFSTPVPTKQTFAEIASRSLSDTRDGLLKTFPSMLNAISMIWNAWDIKKTTMQKDSVVLASCIPLAIGSPKDVRISVLQLITPIAMNHTVSFLSSVADVWGSSRNSAYSKPHPTVRGKEWTAVINKRFIPEISEKQQVLLEILQAIKALSLQTILDSSKQVLRQLMTDKEALHPVPLEICYVQFLYELLKKNNVDSILQVKSSLLVIVKDILQMNVTPPSLFVSFTIFNIYVHCVPVPEERRARRELQDVAQKYLENFNNIAAASLEGSAWFRRSLQVVTTQLDQSSEFEESSISDTHSAQDSVVTASPSISYSTKSSQYSIPAILIMAEYLSPLLDMLYLSEEKDKIASSLVYLMYNVIPYLKNHGPQNISGYHACSSLLAAISDYQYTFRAWKKDVYELFLDSEFFHFDLLSLSYWRTVIDRLITYDPTIFKDLMQKIVVSQSGAINIFANREQEMVQRGMLLKRLSFIIFCGEFDQYHQYLPDIQERLAESIRQLQGPFLHEQVFLCFRVMITRMSPNHLVSLWPAILTELVLVFIHMEHELSSANKPKGKSKVAALESFLGMNGYIKDPNKWLRLYLAVCKLLDFLLILPSETLPHYQVYKWAFTETPGMYCVESLAEIEKSFELSGNSSGGEKTPKDQKRRSDSSKHKEEVSKMSMLNAPINEQKKQALKEKQKQRNHNNKKQNLKSYFLPYISRVLKILSQQNIANEHWQPIIRLPGELIIKKSKITNINELIPFFLSVTGETVAHDVDVTKLSKFRNRNVEELIEKDFIELQSDS